MSSTTQSISKPGQPGSRLALTYLRDSGYRLAPNLLPQFGGKPQLNAAQRGPFSIGFGREDTPGVLAERIDAVISSDTAISWDATFEPFRAELPGSCDWIAYGVLANDDPASLDRIAKQWAQADGDNPALERTLPVDFARKIVVENANHDLATVAAAQPKMSASLDALHTQVVSQRLATNSGWMSNGYAVPILFPRVGSLTWDEIVELRRDRHLVRFRGVMREIEQIGLSEAASGDVETAVHHIYEHYFARTVVPSDGIAKTLGRASIRIILSLGAGVATLGLSPAVGIPMGAAVGLPSMASAVVKVHRSNRRNGWLSIVQQLSEPIDS